MSDNEDDAIMDRLGLLIRNGEASALLLEIAKAPWLVSQPNPAWCGNTLLMEALQCRQVECALALIPLSGGKHKNELQETALILAAASGMEECVEALLPLSEANDLDNSGMSALMRAAYRGHDRVIEALLSSQSALAKATDKFGATALTYALVNHQTGSARLLLPHSDLSAETENGFTPLSYAAKAGFADIVESILPFASAKTVSADGFTPLMLAANNTREDMALACVKALLPFSDVGFRAPTSPCWMSGMSAADMARKNGFCDMAALIEGFESARKEREELGSSLPLQSTSGSGKAASRKLRV